VTICEDIWNDEDFWPHRRYRANPVGDLLAAGARHIFNISASPWNVGKEKLRAQMLASLARKSGRPVALCNLVGGNDELVFDGGSMVFNGAGELIAQGKAFEEDFVVVDTETARRFPRPRRRRRNNVYRALVLGLRDYFHKCGFKSAVLGLSGGIDSAVVACLAVAALGPDHVQGVSLPSQFSSQGSLDDARLLAKRLGLRYEVIPIQPCFEAVKQQVANRSLAAGPKTRRRRNIQARLRGVILMALVQQIRLPLVDHRQQERTGGGLLHPLRRHVRRAGRHQRRAQDDGLSPGPLDQPRPRNHPRRLHHQAALGRIAPNQTDQDSLPPYETLDAILEQYVVQGRSLAEIARWASRRKRSNKSFV
jgi:NAD+ synthase (glutamine-hydrolysing)